MRLIVEQGDGLGNSIPLQGGAFVVGRGEKTDLRLPETGVSRQHARLQLGEQGWLLVDLDSTNGTFVNGQRLPSNQPYLLKPGDRITIGRTVLAVRLDEPGAAHLEESPQQPVLRKKRRPALLAAGAVVLVAVLVGVVILLVTLLQPEASPVTPTVAGPLDQITTAFPVPSGVQGVMTSVATLLPPGFLDPPSESTPTPEAALPPRGIAKRSDPSAAPAPLPDLFSQPSSGGPTP